MPEPASPLPPFAGLRAFHAAARRGKLKDAAEDLGVTESAVSHQVRRLEDFLGVALFDRSGPRLDLTDAGRRYFDAVDPAVARIREATADLLGPPDRAQVALTVPPSLASLWLIPNMTSFEEHCPGIDLKFVTTARLCDLRRDQIDLAIRHGQGGWPGLDSAFLFEQQSFPVCSPGYLDADAASAPEAALARARLIVSDLHPEEWTEWTRAQGLTPPSTHGAMVLNGPGQVLEGAEHGLGIAMGRRPLVDEHLAKGALVTPFGTGHTTQAGYYLCTPADVTPTAAARRVMRWIRQLAADREPAPGG
ncbi:LysR substrate-binding domain-containing protein [Limimonas halophila]|nr:LysR substrate-binding domain-containing protein [Limimonas halophila]